MEVRNMSLAVAAVDPPSSGGVLEEQHSLRSGSPRVGVPRARRWKMKTEGWPMEPLAGRRVHAMLSAALIVGSIGSGAVIASQGAAGAMTAVKLYVNAATGTKATGCTGTGAKACKTVQEGVTAAETTRHDSDAVIITVAAGTYTGGITIAASKLASLTLQGAGVATAKVTGGGSTRDFSVTGGTVAILGFSITDGTAVTGGGIFQNGGTLSVTDDTFSGDSARTGAGVSNGGGTNTFTDDTFTGDTAWEFGAGVFNQGGTDVFTDDTFTGGHSYYYGGGVSTVHGTATMTDDTFSGDAATSLGGGVSNVNGTVALTDDTFSGDVAKQWGGGVFNASTSSFTMTDDTFSKDTAGIGGAVFQDTPHRATARASVFDASSCFGSFWGNYNVTTTTTCKIGSASVEATTLDLTTTLRANTSTGPETLALGPTSVAINEVPKKACTVTVDERGDARPGDRAAGQTKCDAGAYELQHTATTLDQGTPTYGAVTQGTASSFQLSVTNPQATIGAVRFHATGATPPGVKVSVTGRIRVAASTPGGTYTLTGTDTDPLHDSGAWTFTLVVWSAPKSANTSSGTR